jgi:hypothetical protein
MIIFTYKKHYKSEDLEEYKEDTIPHDVEFADIGIK